MKLLQIISIGVGVMTPVIMTVRGADGTSPMTATITLPNGASRVVKVEGVGCTRSICSRTEIKGKGQGRSAPLDAIAFAAIDTIQTATPDRAQIVLKDGTRQGMSLVTDFRVLYFWDESGKPQKLDLSAIRSVQFAPQR